MEHEPQADGKPGQFACEGEDPEIFFPVLEESRDRPTAESERAKDICRRCGVLQECLEIALVRHEQGIWGGTTTMERKRLLHKGQPIKRRTAS
ncbi:MAG: WhiB family transcriptional regulator [Candidatus Saccharibacteria bacterium]